MPLGNWYYGVFFPVLVPASHTEIRCENFLVFSWHIAAPVAPRTPPNCESMAAVIDSALPSEITEDYEVGQTLGTGHFSKVKLGTNRKTGEKVAIKVLAPPRDVDRRTAACAMFPAVLPRRAACRAALS